MTTKDTPSPGAATGCVHCDRGVPIQLGQHFLKSGNSSMYSEKCTRSPTPAAQGAVAEGWRMVPKVPTYDMLEAGRKEIPHVSHIWMAMIAAAPIPAPAIDEALPEDVIALAAITLRRSVPGLFHDGIRPEDAVQEIYRAIRAAIKGEGK